MFVHSDAFAAQYDSVSARVQQLTGRTITAVFRRDSIRSIIAQPNARAIRFLTSSDGSPNGAAKTSSDRIVLRFKNDEVERVSVLGGTETTYYKQVIVPDPFQLEGYIWTPEAKPERSDFMRESRVRERLNLPPRPAPADPPEAAQPESVRPDSARSDSVRSDSVRPDSAIARSASEGESGENGSESEEEPNAPVESERGEEASDSEDVDSAASDDAGAATSRGAGNAASDDASNTALTSDASRSYPHASRFERRRLEPISARRETSASALRR